MLAILENTGRLELWREEITCRSDEQVWTRPGAVTRWSFDKGFFRVLM